ncbi:aspartyl-phosphate phosphatase Spo0E family protein [Paenibacillus sp. YYML68]|uniref:aspartyl-phosphate phosphatase Spo0E family protein n=1 Tax=Paenibacillus sp. YYML68 TaxID=2909250 RepID=UPI0024923B66|nr:aspartyl-phosphate phosphatase Spo0E family protein [Paenibacillus sp. YYML68]
MVVPTSLDYQIEYMKQELVDVALSYQMNLQHARVLAVSEQLDKLIVQAQMLRRRLVQSSP